MIRLIVTLKGKHAFFFLVPMASTCKHKSAVPLHSLCFLCNDYSSYPEKDSLLDAFDESFERLRRENAKLREALGITSAKEAMARVSQEFAAMENSEDTLPLDETFFTEAAKGEGWDVADPLCGDLLQKDW